MRHTAGLKMEAKHENENRTAKKRIGILCGILLFLCLWAISWIPVTEHITLSLKGAGQTGVRVCLVTDLHSCYYGKDQKWLIDRIDREKPDLVVLGGDIFDDKLSDKNTKCTLEQLACKYPCYYVTGNHEFWSGRAAEMKDYVRSIGITVLEGDCSTLEVGGTTLDLCGVDDPDDMTMDAWREQLDRAFAKTEDSHVKILVSHRPEKVSVYEQYGFDLILTGHAHSGQFRIPFLNIGMAAPDQGFFARYVNGIYELSNGSLMEVSRGLGRESTPLPRFFNHPEVVILTLQEG